MLNVIRNKQTIQTHKTLPNVVTRDPKMKVNQQNKTV